MTPLEWALSDDTGMSSETIMHVMEGTPPPSYGVSVPQDPDDFGRCHRLLRLFPHYRKRLHEVADKYPMWVGLVRDWDRLTDLFDEHRNNDLYDAMQPLIDEGRVADGWVKTGPGSWTKGEHGNVQLGPGVSIGF
ncbi:hypothetical protein [Rhodanobacter sp. 115]|uniref:hypothetical protein n=1 Tax=Rhodanobacter sp. FW021-MT20 TaxID=1162282 RepID=UPI000260C9ED|nr:hypothetical protein [Rhodanobacter sp. 115]EIL95672.1 hypothetical protein UU5_10161 [Rhodanobacter sp. 115]